MFCATCGNEATLKVNFCSNCGTSYSDSSDQNKIERSESPYNSSTNTIETGTNSINTNNTIHVGDNYSDSNNINPDNLNIQRHFVNLPWSSSGKIASRSAFLKLGTWGSLASILGIAIPFITGINYFSTIFVISFVASMILMFIPIFLNKFRFSHLFGLNNIEASTKDSVYLTKITCDCPWCGSEMKLKMLGPKNYKEHILLCERNPGQHRILFDATVLPDIVD